MALPSYIPASENPLVSMFNQTNETSLTQQWYSMLYNVSSNTTLSILPDNVASLTFNASDPLLFLSLPLIILALHQDAIRMAIPCIYPLSGQYDTLSRILFYVLMVFSLVFQRYEEISTAALVTAMTYATISAVHALALVTLFGGNDQTNIFTAQPSGDPDIFGVFPILAVSGIMLTPILMWSSIVRNHHGQAVILAWGILILTALGAVTSTLIRSNEKAGVDVLLSLALCTNTSPSCRLFAEGSIASLVVENFPKDVYDNCGCMDFCSTYSPTAPMRKGANMVALSTNNPAFSASSVFDHMTVVGIPVIVFVFVSGIFGILESQWSQEDVRNGIFALINGERFKFLYRNRKVQTFCAKCLAASVFFTGILVSILAPMIFVFAITTFELYLVDWPQSEQSDSVGAWGGCVGAGLVLLATIFASYKSVWVNYIRYIFGFQRHRRKSYVEKTPKSEKTKFTDLCLKPIRKAKSLAHRFVAWWKDPERIYAERQQEREKERELKEALEEEQRKFHKEISRLRSCIRDLHSKGHGTECKAIHPTNASTDGSVDQNRGDLSNNSVFYNTIQESPSTSNNGPYTPISSRSFYDSRNSATELQIMEHDPTW